MRASKDMASRMRQMLTQDRVGIREGFFVALNSDVKCMLSSYFQLEGSPSISIEQRDDGLYSVAIEASASRIKQFESTLDIKRY